MAGSRLTFSGIAAYRAEFFAGIAPGTRAQLAPLLIRWIGRGMVSGERFDGRWRDIGTPQRLELLNRELAAAN